VQVASESTLEEADGVYVSTDGPRGSAALLEPGSMERFAALRSLWLRQVNMLTLLVTPGMSLSLRRGTQPSSHKVCVRAA